MEQLLTLLQVARMFPSNGESGHVAKNTIWRYCNVGVQVGNENIQLEVIWTPSGRRWTESGVKRFLDRLTAAKEAERRLSDPSAARPEPIRLGVLRPEPSLAADPTTEARPRARRGRPRKTG